MTTMTTAALSWTEQRYGSIEKYVARDSHFNTWTVRKALDKEPGPWRIYVSGRYLGLAISKEVGMAKVLDLIASRPQGNWEGR